MSLICNKFEPLTIDEVETLLLRHEASLDKFHKKKSLVSVNLTEGVSLSNSPIVQIAIRRIRKIWKRIKDLNYLDNRRIG